MGGSEQLETTTFFQKVKEAGYDGVEMVLPYGAELKSKIIEETTRLGIEIIGLCGGVIEGYFKKSIRIYEEHLRNACSINPMFVNIQTGKDHFTFEQNLAFIKVADKISKETNTKYNPQS